jgi:hypothetical protein
MRVEDVAGDWPGRYYSPRHEMPAYSRNEASQSASMTWREISAMFTRHIIGCRLTRKKRGAKTWRMR